MPSSQHELKNRLAFEVRQEREIRGWSQQELADRSGVSRLSICRLEACASDARLSTLCRLSEAFGWNCKIELRNK